MPQPFLDIAFPPFVARGATGGPAFSTSVVALASGAEQRNMLWSAARGRWNVSTGIRSRAEMLEVIAFFRIVKGKAHSFRFKDWTDFEVSDAPMVEVSPTVWQLVKRYAFGSLEHVRAITKPVAGTVRVEVGGSPVAPAGIDHLTGKVTFAAPPSATPTASFAFDVPVRFDTDHLPVQANAFDQQVVPDIDLVEVLE